MSFVIFTTVDAPPVVYVPTATLILPPLDAFPIAPLMVTQGVEGEVQELLSFPEGDTNKSTFVNIKLADPDNPDTVVVTLYVPNWELAVKIDETATP
jgi:hypothetical protein